NRRRPRLPTERPVRRRLGGFGASLNSPENSASDVTYPPDGGNHHAPADDFGGRAAVRLRRFARAEGACEAAGSRSPCGAGPADWLSSRARALLFRGSQPARVGRGANVVGS